MVMDDMLDEGLSITRHVSTSPHLPPLDWQCAVAKFHASLESASSQLAQQPAIGIFFINVRRPLHTLHCSRSYLRRLAGTHPKICACCRSEGAESFGTAASLQGRFMVCIPDLV